MAVRTRVRKPAATAASPAAKTATKAKAKGVTAETSASEERAAKFEAQTKQVVKLRDSGSKWDEIGEAVGITPGRAIHLYDVATLDDSERIKFKSDEDLGGKLLKLRGTTSWGRLSARTGVSEPKLKRLYVEAGGEENSRLGKGGRHPGGGTAKKSAVRTRGKASSKPAAKPTAVRTRAKK